MGVAAARSYKIERLTMVTAPRFLTGSVSHPPGGHVVVEVMILDTL
jgi:hypothetical protein